MPGWLAPLLSWFYWFAAYPPPFVGLLFWLVLGVAGGGFVLGLILRLVAAYIKEPSTRRIMKRLGTLGLTMGVLTAISFFFTQTSTPTLGSRFWFALWFVISLVWLGFILKYAFWQAPQERAERDKQLQYQKYLPR